MSDQQDSAPEVEAEPVVNAEAQEDTSPQKAKDDNPPQENSKSKAPEEAEEPKEETVEEKLARLERLEQDTQAAKKKISAQRKAYAALQKAAQEKDAKLKEFESLKQSQGPQQPVKPVLDDFESYQDYEAAQEKYVEELADFKAKEKYQSEREKQLQLEAKEAQAKVMRERNANYEAAKKDLIAQVPEFVESEAEFNDYLQQATTPPDIAFAIAEQANSHEEVSVPELIHYFAGNGGENLVLLDEISKMSPLQAAVEIYKVQEQIKSSPKPERKSEPLPKPPQGARGGGAKKKPGSKMSGKELLQWVNS